MREDVETTPKTREMSARHGGQAVRLAAVLLCLLASASVVRAQFLDSPMRIAGGPPGQILVSDSRQDKVFAIDQESLAPVWSFAVP